MAGTAPITGPAMAIRSHSCADHIGHPFFIFLIIATALTECNEEAASHFSLFGGFKAWTCRFQHTKNCPVVMTGQFLFCAGINLSSRDVAIQVFSAPVSLTTVFGMGTGGTSLP